MVPVESDVTSHAGAHALARLFPETMVVAVMREHAA